MKTLTLLHITDLHFGFNTSPYEKTVECKDSETTASLKNVFKDGWVDAFENKLLQWQRENEQRIDIIAFTGDLCYQGNESNMEEGIQFLVRISKKLELGLDNIIISPGNHDLDRNKPNSEFDSLVKLCKKYKIENYSCYDKIKKIECKGIPIISTNSCMGATARVDSFNIEYYKNHLQKLNDPDFEVMMKKASENESLFYQTDLDIPAIGDTQLENLLTSLSESGDSCIIMMHHNPIPNANIEIRPYSNMLDNGVIIYKLLDTGKKIFVLHGHTHFPSCISSFLPQQGNRNNFLSTIGCGCLNGSENGKAEIIEFMFTENNFHFKTTVHEIARSSTKCFMTNNFYEIRNRDGEINIDIAWSKLVKGKRYSVQEIKAMLKESNQNEDLNEEDILMGLLNLSNIFIINKNQSGDPNSWFFTRKH